jgi:hypothetical protein
MTPPVCAFLPAPLDLVSRLLSGLLLLLLLTLPSRSGASTLHRHVHRQLRVSTSGVVLRGPSRWSMSSPLLSSLLSTARIGEGDGWHSQWRLIICGMKLGLPPPSRLNYIPELAHFAHYSFHPSASIRYSSSSSSLPIPRRAALSL